MDTEYQRHTNINIYLRALDTQAHISFSAYFLLDANTLIMLINGETFWASVGAVWARRDRF